MIISDVIRKKAKVLTGSLTLEEKIGQMMQLDGRNNPELWIQSRGIGSVLHVTGNEIAKCRALAKKTRMGIPLLFGIDAIHGHAFHDGSSVFPVQLGQGATFNPDLIRAVGGVTASEVLNTGLDWTFAPVLCLARDPRWGRLSESFGEDAFLSGSLGAAYIEGAQIAQDGRVVVSCAKHFIGCAESRGGRDSADCSISKRMILEQFLPPFQKAIASGCLSIMIGYQSIDGIPCTASKWLIQDILIKKLGFEGIIVTDWDNTGRLHREQGFAASMDEAVRIVLTSGCSMVMATEEFYERAILLCKKDESLIAYVDAAVSRNLAVKMTAGLFDAAFETRPFIPDYKLAYECAVQSLVLLTNRKGALPLKSEARVFLSGPQVDSIYNQLGEWSFGPQEFSHKTRRPYHQGTQTLLRGAKARDASITIAHCWGEIIDGGNERGPLDLKAQKTIDALVAASTGYDAYVMAIGDSFEMNGECLDRSDLSLSPSQMYALTSFKLKNPDKPLIAVVIGGKPVVGREFYALCDAVLECWNPGIAGGDAIWDVLYGIRDAEGRLPISIPRSIGQIPVFYNQLPGWHADRYLDLEKGPQFPFGFGLSYSTCKIVDSFLKQNIMTMAELKSGGLFVSVTVRNTSFDYDAISVIQVYLHDVYASVVQPIKRLVGFKKIQIPQLCEKVVDLHIDSEEFSFVDEYNSRVIEPGLFEIHIGFCSDDADCICHRFTLKQ